MNQFLTSFLLLTSIALHAVTVDAHEIPKRSLLRGSSNTIVQADDSNHRQKREAQMEERGASASMDEEYEERGDSLSQDEDCEGMDCEPFGSEDSLDEDYEDEEEESFDFTKEDIGMMSHMQMMTNDPPASYGTDGKYKDEEEEDITLYEDNGKLFSFEVDLEEEDEEEEDITFYEDNGKLFSFEVDLEEEEDEEDMDLGPEEGEDLMESFDFDFEDKKKEVNDATGGEMMSPQEFEEFMEKQYEEQNQKEAMMGYEGEEEGEGEEEEDSINSVGAMLKKKSEAEMGSTVSGMTVEEYEDYMAGLA